MPQHKPFPYTLDPEQIPTKKNLDMTRADYEGGPCVRYSCPDACWKEHVDAWVRERRKGNNTSPCPEPYGHCMFIRPVGYGMVPYGCTDPATIRAAWESHVRAMLSGGWDRDVSKEQLDKIINATVEAKMNGKDIGAAPFMACVMATI